MSGGNTGPIVVVFDRGAASPGEIGVGLRRIGVPAVTVLGASEYAEEMRPLMAALGPVLSSRDGSGSNVAALREAGARGIVTFSERMQTRTADLSVALVLPYHLPETVRLLTDKYAQRRCLGGAGIPQAAGSRRPRRSPTDPLSRN